MKLKLIVIFLAACSAWAQFSGPPGVLNVTADPAGTCSVGSNLQFNVTNGKLWGCNAGTWAQISGGGGGGAVSSVFTRTGAVVAVTGDYTAAQVTNAVDTTSTYSNPGWITALANSKITGLTAFATLATGATTTYVRGDASTQTLNVAALTDGSHVIVDTGSYSNPGWITALAYAKITGAPTVTGGTCTNQVVTAISNSVVPTCNTITSAYVDSSIVPATRTINGHALSANVTVSASDLTTGTLPAAQLPQTFSVTGPITLSGSGAGVIDYACGTTPSAPPAGQVTPFCNSANSNHWSLENSAGAVIDLQAFISTVLTSAHILVGNGSNVATDVAVSGDVTMTNAGAVSVTATHLSAPLPRAQGGLNSTSAGTGILRDGSTPAASELSGDATTSGSNVVTLPAINSNVGACGDATHTSQITLNAKGQATACTPVAISGVGGGNAAVANLTAVTVSANTTSDQTLQELTLSSAVLNTLAAPFLIHGSGIFTIAIAQTPTLTFKAKLCTVSGCGSGTVVTLATIATTATVAATNNPWNLNLKMATVSTGASGTVIVHGPLIIDTGATTTVAEVVFNDTNTAASSAINLTGSLFIDFTVATSAGNAGNSFTQQIATLEPASSQGAAGATGAAGTLNFPINPQTATYQVLAADFTSCKVISVASGTFTATLVASGSQPSNGQCIWVLNYGSGVVTIARSGQNINGGTASLSLTAGSATAPTAAFILSDGTNYFASLMGGSSGAVSSVGGLTGAVPGGLILVEQHTASTSTALNFTTCISGSYDQYAIQVVGLLTTSALDLHLQFSSDGGSTWNSSSNYAWAYIYNQGSGAGNNSSSGQTSVTLAGSTLSNLFPVDLTITLNHPQGGLAITPGLLQSSFDTTAAGGTFTTATGTFYYNGTTSWNAFRIYSGTPGTNTIASGTVRCYGVAKQ